MSTSGQAGPSIRSFPEDLLQCIFTRVLPCEGLHVTSAALSNRQTYLKHAYATGVHRNEPQSHCNAAWRSSLDGIDAAACLLDSPPWCRGRKADELYKRAAMSAAGMPMSLVCKQWRRVARERKASVAVCEVGEAPPASAQVLVIASMAPWRGGTASRKELEYLLDLKTLKAVAFWCFASGDPNSIYTLRSPAVPSGLNRLRHLLYVTAAGREEAALSRFALRGFEDLANLETLSLADLAVGVVGATEKRLWASLPRLRALDIPFFMSAEHCASAYPALRRLHINIRSDKYFSSSLMPSVSDTYDVKALSRLAALDTLSLECGNVCWLFGLGALSQLAQLSLRDVLCADVRDVLGALTALTALTALRVSRDYVLVFNMEGWAKDFLEALGSMPEPPRLSLRLCDGKDFYGLAKLTTLEQLDTHHMRTMLVSGTDDDVLLLSELAALTALTIDGHSLNDDDTLPFCEALSCLTALRKLDIADFELHSPEVVRELTALQSLSLGAGCCPPSSTGWLAAMELPQTCPGLTALELHDVPDAEDVLRLEDLEVLTLQYSKGSCRSRLESEVALHAGLLTPQCSESESDVAPEESERLRAAGVSKENTMLFVILANAPRFWHLRVLHLDGCSDVDDSYLERLMGCKSLMAVSVAGTRVSKGPSSAAVRALNAQGVFVRT